MVGNFIRFNNKNIDNRINNFYDQTPKNIPCKIDKINDDLTVDLISLVDESPFYSISMFFPIGITYDFNRLKFGILYYVNYDFSSLMDNSKLNYQIDCSQTQFGIFIPLLDSENYKPYSDYAKDNKEITIFNTNADNKISLETDNIIIDNKEKAFINMEDGSITISNDNDNNNIKLNNELVITSNNPINIATNSASLYEILNDILNMLSKMNADPVAGNGASLASPTLTSELPNIITKLNGVLK